MLHYQAPPHVTIHSRVREGGREGANAHLVLGGGGVPLLQTVEVDVPCVAFALARCDLWQKSACTKRDVEIFFVNSQTQRTTNMDIAPHEDHGKKYCTSERCSSFHVDNIKVSLSQLLGPPISSDVP